MTYDQPKLTPAARALIRKVEHKQRVAKLLGEREEKAEPDPIEPTGHTSGFDRIIAQERGNFHISWDHT